MSSSLRLHGLQDSKASLSITNSWSLLRLVHWVSDAILCCFLLLLPSISPSIRGLFQRVSSSHQVAKVWLHWVANAKDEVNVFSWALSKWALKVRSGNSLAVQWSWKPTPLFLPAEFHGRRSLAGYSPWTRKASNMTEWHFHFLSFPVIKTPRYPI